MLAACVFVMVSAVTVSAEYNNVNVPPICCGCIKPLGPLPVDPIEPYFG